MTEKEATPIEELNDPTNYEFMETPHGEKIHIVGTGLPTSILVRGGRASGKYTEDSQQALCGTVSEFTPTDDIPETVNGVIANICTRCNNHAWRISNKGKFEEIPL